MFERNVSLSKFSAGSNIASVEQRIQRLESLIDAVDHQQQRRIATEEPEVSTKPSFRNYLSTPPLPPAPRVNPVTGPVKQRFEAIQPLVQKYADQFGVDCKLVNAVIQQESAFNPNAVSRCGAQGLMQLMPSTAKELGVQNPFNAEQNVAGGVKYLSGLLGKYKGNVALALAAYNAGSGAVDKHKGVPPYKETQQYVRKILATYLNARNNA